jgi:hypothetical protein
VDGSGREWAKRGYVVKCWVYAPEVAETYPLAACDLALVNRLSLHVLVYILSRILL